jgi:hypothetical protein
MLGKASIENLETGNPMEIEPEVTAVFMVMMGGEGCGRQHVNVAHRGA